MQKAWFIGAVAVLAIGAGVLFMTERPLTVTVVEPEPDVALRIYGLGTVEARVLTRVGFEVSATLLSLSADAGDRVAKGQILGALHQGEQEARVARAHAAVAASHANQAKAEASVVRARAILAQRETANLRLLELSRQEAASLQRAEEDLVNRARDDRGQHPFSAAGEPRGHHGALALVVQLTELSFAGVHCVDVLARNQPAVALVEPGLAMGQENR